MPEIEIHIGGRPFSVACQAGEEPFLQAAARMLDTEASVILGQIGRMPSERMLLMAGLMLADRTAGMQDKLATLEAELAQLKSAPAPPPERIEVPVMPAGAAETLAELTARAEALAAQLEEKTTGPA